MYAQQSQNTNNCQQLNQTLNPILALIINKLLHSVSVSALQPSYPDPKLSFSYRSSSVLQFITQFQFFWIAIIERRLYIYCYDDYNKTIDKFAILIMQEKAPHQGSLSSESINQIEKIFIVNSFSRNTINRNKKYITNRKNIYRKGSNIKPSDKPQQSKHSQKHQSFHTENIQSKSASVLNLEFQQGKIKQSIKGAPNKNPYKPQTVHQKKSHFNTIEQASRKIVNIYRQNSKSKYHELFKQSVDDFFKNTLQIGPYANGLLKNKEIDQSNYRKLIYIEKIAFPFRQTQAQNMRNKTTYSRMNHTTHRNADSSISNKHKRIKSFLDNSDFYPEQKTFSDRRPQSFQKPKPKTKHNILQSLIPVRKPNNKKDYFVFGLSDRTGTTQNKIEMFRDMLWKVNYSNCLYVFTPDNIRNSNQSYKFYVGPGNNCNLIKGILKRRFWWTITTNKNQEGINFIWTQLKYNQYFRLQESNSLPIAYKLSGCSQKVDNSTHENTMNSESQFANINKIFNAQDMKTWRNHYKKNEKTQKTLQQNTYKRRMKLYEKKEITKIQDSNDLKMHNHLQFNYYIGNKKALFYNVKRFCQLQKKNPFLIIPHTFHIKKGVEDPEWKVFLSYYEEMEQYKKSLPSKNQSFRNMWICKPGQNTNRGNGITVCYTLDDIKIRLNGKERNRDGQLRTFILQKYIQNPMLYQRRKFDIRHYALITCINGVFKFYWYEEGYIRTSSSQFNMKVNRDPLIHLTNDAIQKNTSDYGKFQKGNKLSYQEFQKYLQTTYPSKKYNFYEQILPRMKQYATEAFRASYSILDERRLENNFQLLGLDFMIDEKFQPWLIQINTNPCLELSSPLLGGIIPHLIENVCRICIDPLFPPPENWPANKKTFFPQDPLSENKFTVTFDESINGQEIQEIFKGHKKIDLNMGKIQEEDETYQDEGKQDWEQKPPVQ